MTEPITLEAARAQLAELEATRELGREEYSEVQGQLVIFGGFIARLPLDAFLSRIARTEALGPIADPTLYMRAIDKLERVKALASAANGLRLEVIRQARLELAERERGVRT